jgi:hypothetical protein
MKEMSKMKELREKEYQKFTARLNYDNKEDKEFKKADIIFKFNTIGFIILCVMMLTFGWLNTFGKDITVLLGNLLGNKVALKTQDDKAFDNFNDNFNKSFKNFDDNFNKVFNNLHDNFNKAFHGFHDNFHDNFNKAFATLKIQNDKAFDTFKIQNDNVQNNNNAFDPKLFSIFFTIFFFMILILSISRFYFGWKYWEYFWVKYSKPRTMKVLKDIIEDLKKEKLI